LYTGIITEKKRTGEKFWNTVGKIAIKFLQGVFLFKIIYLNLRLTSIREPVKALEQYDVLVHSLKNKVYDYVYEDGDAFFACFEQALVEQARFRAQVRLEKSEVMIRLNFHIEGFLHLVCDRSLEPFEHPFVVEGLQILQFGAQEEELSDEMRVIPRGIDKINLAPYIYELIALQVPMKKLHPSLQNAPENEAKFIYSSENTQTAPEEIDPRWEKLKKLKN